MNPVYVEIAACARHQPFVDHLYVLADNGTLTGPGRFVFASPFRDVCFSRRADGTSDPTLWRYNDRPPRPRKTPRAQSFSGWMLGVRGAPFASNLDHPSTALRRHLSDIVVRAQTQGTLDAVVRLLDRLADSLAHQRAGTRPTLTTALYGPASHADVTTLAAAAHMSPRTLQRQVRRTTTLTPKRWLALRRFDAATHRIIHGTHNLAQFAVDEGYADQAHLTAEFSRFAGVSPARFRAAADQEREDNVVRFFKDGAIRARVRLLISPPSSTGKTSHDIPDNIRTQGS